MSPAAILLGRADEVWREAQATLLDHLKRQDPDHSLQRLARGVAALSGTACAIVPLDRDGTPAPSAWLGGATADAAQLHQQGLALPLCYAGERVGELRLQLAPSGVDLSSLAAALAPLLDTAAGLLAHRHASTRSGDLSHLAQIRTALRESGTFVWEWDIESDVLGDIDEGALMLGYAPHELGHTQDDWTRLIHPDHVSLVEEAYQRHARGESPGFHATYQARAADGQWRWIEERGRIIERDAAGQPRRMVGTQTDATVSQALEQARRERLAAEAANAAKTQFLSRVSHELRTPLNAVLGFAQVLEMDSRHPLAEHQRRQVALIRQAGSHLLAMIGDLLDVSLVESGRLSVAHEPVALGPLLKDALALVDRDAREAAIPLHLATVPAAATVRADATRLRQVVINLLSNGIKYNRAGGEVRVSVAAAALAGGAPAWAIEVLDTGLGIPPERMARLFEPFNRLGREHSGIPGAGLGLALAQMLVQAMGGEISATSCPAHGTCFSVRLPRLDA